MAQDIIETINQAKSEDVQAQIHAARVLELQALGYTIITSSEGIKGIVPKNSATGLDDPTAQITWLWDIPKVSPEGTFYIEALPSVLPAEDIVGEQFVDYTERPKPVEWTDGYTGNNFNSQFNKDDFEV